MCSPSSSASSRSKPRRWLLPDLHPEDPAGAVREGGGDDQRLRAPPHPADVPPAGGPAAGGDGGGPRGRLGLRPEGHHLHAHTPLQQQVGFTPRA